MVRQAAAVVVEEAKVRRVGKGGVDCRVCGRFIRNHCKEQQLFGDQSALELRQQGREPLCSFGPAYRDGGEGAGGQLRRGLACLIPVQPGRNSRRVLLQRQTGKVGLERIKIAAPFRVWLER